MSGSEAGHCPPLQPRELPSRHSADALQPKISFPHLLIATQQEFQQAEYHQYPERTLVHQTLKRVVYAGRNMIKLGELRSTVQNAVHKDLPVDRIDAEESPVANVQLAARSKAFDAEMRMWELRPDHPIKQDFDAEGVIILANDIRESVPRVKTNPQTGEAYVEYRSLGKPESPEQVKGNFAKLSQVAQQEGWPEVPYIIEAATLINNPTLAVLNLDAQSLRKACVLLPQEVVTYLATEEGFAIYAEKTAQLAGNGRQVHEIAGGFELKALQKVAESLGHEIRITEDPLETKETWQQLEAKEKQDRFDRAYGLAMGKSDERLIKRYCELFSQPMTQLEERLAEEEYFLYMRRFTQQM